MKGKVAIFFGSKSDTEKMSKAASVLKEFGVEYKAFVISAHRAGALLAKTVKETRCCLIGMRWKQKGGKMSDLISRQVSIDEWKNDFKGYINALNIPKDDYNGIMEYIDELPSAQPEPKTGHWILSDVQSEEELRNNNYLYYCSECGKGDVHSKSVEVPFCWHCGAKMLKDGEG